jgi:anti-sigma regulatory factor (Ser/Thr protein kinase)
LASGGQGSLSVGGSHQRRRGESPFSDRPAADRTEQRSDVDDVTLPASPAAARTARAFVQEFCRRHELPVDTEDDAVLITSEVVGNAWLHARSGTHLQLGYQQGVLRIEISDGSTRQPVRRESAALDRNGRGLLIMDVLAQSWGVDELPSGKTVWFELTR